VETEEETCCTVSTTKELQDTEENQTQSQIDYVCLRLGHYPLFLWLFHLFYSVFVLFLFLFCILFFIFISLFTYLFCYYSYCFFNSCVALRVDHYL
jgi:hypothetical protein